jgi:hypothetical protein
MAGKRPKFWMQRVKEQIARKGTAGSFGKASAKKIAAGKAAGGKQAKRALLAETFKRFAKRGAKGRTKSRAPKR